jgi:hypothetical protein
VERAISGTSMNKNTNVGAAHGSGSPPTRRQSSEGSHGRKRPMDVREVRPFYTGPTQGGSSRTPTSTVSHRQDVDENNDISKRRCVKRFIKTKIGDNVEIGLRNLTLEVEREVPMNFGNEEQVLGDNEMIDSDSTDREEAPCDCDAVKLDVVTSNVGTPSVNLRPRRHSRAS